MVQILFLVIVPFEGTCKLASKLSSFFFSRLFVSVSVIKLLVCYLNGYFSHRDKNLRQDLGAPLYLLMGSQR